MNRSIEVLLVVLYNLALLAGASYLVYYKDGSGWLYVVALMFGATWRDKCKDEFPKEPEREKIVVPPFMKE